MKRKWINIRIEIKTREFQSKALLIYHLLAEGFGVIVKNKLGENPSFFPKGIYLINSMYANAHEKIRKITDYGNQIYVLDEEGLVIRRKDEYLKRIPKENMRLITKFLCNGESQYKIVKDKFPEFANKFIIVGNPRMNLLDEKFNGVEENKVNQIKQRYGNYILIVSNFGTVNITGSKTDKKSRYLKKLNHFKKLGIISNVEEELDFDNRFEHYEAIFQAFIKLINRVGNQEPDLKVIIRPHPSEDNQIWEEVAKKYSNINVIKEGSLNEWIKGSKIVVQNGCTSAIESLLLNKLCVSYRPVVNDKYDQLLPSKVTLNVYNEDSLLDLLKKAYYRCNRELMKDSNNYKRILEDYLSYFDEDKSVLEIVKSLKNSSLKSYYYNRFIYRLKTLKYNFLFVKPKRIKLQVENVFYKTLRSLKLTKNRMYYFLHEKKTRQNINKQIKQGKMGVLKEHDFTEIFDHFDKIYNRRLQVNVKAISDYTFIITKKPKA